MTVIYNKYYQTENLFGEPYSELIDFFTTYSKRGKVLDLGCGQGRNSIALARIGYTVTGIDTSSVGIDQMNMVSQSENLQLTGQVNDIFKFNSFSEFDFILLDSMFHFIKKDKNKEIGLIHDIVSNAKSGCLIVICLQESGNNVQILNEALDIKYLVKRLDDRKFQYSFIDKASGHKSTSNYRMIVAQKFDKEIE